jgi:channel protein (hemolysin III family)
MFLQHDEARDKHWFRPRHPIVAGQDILGMASALFFLCLTSTPANTSYFAAMFLLFFFSCLYHWTAYSGWSNRLDHAMIFIFIAFTAVPYWGAFIPLADDPWFGLTVIVIVALVGGVSKLFSFFPRILSGILYILASLPIIGYMTWYRAEVGNLLYLVWMTGIALYIVQLAVYTWRLCEFKPGLFEHREVQHTLLPTATTLQGIVALSLVG